MKYDHRKYQAIVDPDFITFRVNEVLSKGVMSVEAEPERYEGYRVYDQLQHDKEMYKNICNMRDICKRSWDESTSKNQKWKRRHLSQGDFVNRPCSFHSYESDTAWNNEKFVVSRGI